MDIGLRIRNAARRLALAHCFTMYYHQELVDRYKMHYDRKRFRRYFQYLHQGYCLFQYRKLYPPDQLELASIGYPLSITQQFPFLRFLFFWFAFFTARCGAIAMVPAATGTEWRRVLLGTEHFKNASVFIETTFLFWSAIATLFLSRSLTSNMLDYKFLALYRMSATDARYCRPEQFDLNPEEFEQFRKFRTRAHWGYWSIMVEPTVGILAIWGLNARAGLYTSHPIASAIWMPGLTMWVVWVCGVCYSALVAFLVVGKYIHIKQKSIAASFRRAMSQLKKARSNPVRWQHYSGILWRTFMHEHTRYIHLQDELQDYNHFWCTCLSYFCLFYVLLIAFCIYIVFLSDTSQMVQMTYTLVLYFYIALLGIIIYQSADAVKRNQGLANDFASLLAAFHHSDTLPNLSHRQIMKLNQMGEALRSTTSGFSLVNGYLLTYETYYLLIVNVATYFLLILSNPF